MRNVSLLLIVYLMLSGNLLMAQKEISVNYYKPYDYKAIDGRTVVKAWLDKSEVNQEFSGIATVDISGLKGTEWIVYDAGGKVIPSQIVIKGTERSVTFEAENIPSLGYKTYFLKKGRTHSDSEIKAGTNYYENRFYSVKLGPGGITSLTDRELDRQDNYMGVTMSTNLAVADWIDPGRESVDYTVLQGILLSSHKSCHGEGKGVGNQPWQKFHRNIQDFILVT